MHSIASTTFWRRTPAPARPALLATLVVLGTGLTSFLVLLWLASTSFGVSPLIVMFGPGPGMPLIVWLGSVLGAAALQALVSLALRQRARPVRAIGTVATFALAALCFVFIASAAFSLLDYLTTGHAPGDFYDLLGILFFGVPLAIVIGTLNARACLLEVRELLQ